MFDEHSRDLTPRQARREVLAQPVDRVVPSGRDLDDLEVSEIGELIAQQRAHERVVDVDFGGWGILGGNANPYAARSASRTGAQRSGSLLYGA